MLWYRASSGFTLGDPQRVTSLGLSIDGARGKREVIPEVNQNKNAEAAKLHTELYLPQVGILGYSSAYKP